ncbi:MAG: uracil-DNA glycosylase [Patescibacteria group bacterium]
MPDVLGFNDLSDVANQVRVCERCPLHRTRLNSVPGEGNPQSEILFVGEGPGFNEDKLGRPFVGNAGKFLDEMLNSINLDRTQVFITNIVKCRPPENRDPEDEEKAACLPYLEAQIKFINPKLIVCLGRHSMNYFLPGFKISEVHGQPKHRGDLYILPLYHPAAALHNGGLRQTLMDDFGRIPAIIKKIDQLIDKK